MLSILKAKNNYYKDVSFLIIYYESKRHNLRKITKKEDIKKIEYISDNKNEDSKNKVEKSMFYDITI